jgi:hypothetical protein
MGFEPVEVTHVPTGIGDAVANCRGQRGEGTVVFGPGSRRADGRGRLIGLVPRRSSLGLLTHERKRWKKLGEPKEHHQDDSDDEG